MSQKLLNTSWRHVSLMCYLCKIDFDAFDFMIDSRFCDSIMIDLFKILKICFEKNLVGNNLIIIIRLKNI